MKKTQSILLSIFMLIAVLASAQTLEDVIYLKNGNIYRGTIIEQVPGESYKIQITGGTVFFVKVPEVQKITKEAPTAENPGYNRSGNDEMACHWSHHMGDTSGTPAYMKKHRFFHSIEFRPGLNNIGLRLVRGYKFNHFASLGLGLGLDGVYMGSGISTGKDIYNNHNIDDGLYIPLYLQFTGDILKSRITPYYFIEAGYAFHPQNPFVDQNLTDKGCGGPIGSAGMGVKFHSKGHFSMGINLNATYRSDYSRSNFTFTDMNGNTITTTTNNFKEKIFGSLGW